MGGEDDYICENEEYEIVYEIESGKIGMENQPFFSIVMPVYGVEEYLEKAVYSVLEQSFQDFEIILVDDKSPDNAGKICDEFARKNDKVLVIHHDKNRGLSAARNTGTKKACGKYIWFMDSDDYVESTLLEKVYESLMKNKAQVVVFGVEEEYFDEKGEKKKSKQISLETKYLESKEEVQKSIIKLEESTLYGYAWNKIYDLEYLKQCNIKFEKITLIEDIMFNVQYFEEIERLNILSDVLYYYEKRMGNSLTAKYVNEYFELHRQRVELVYEQQKRWNRDTKEVRSILGKIYCRYIYSAIQRNFDKRSGMNFKMRYQWLGKIYSDALFGELIPYTESDNTQQKVLAFFLKHKMSIGCLGMGRIIDFVKRKMPMVFAKIK